MFPTDILIAYLGACVLVILAPGPDNLLVVSRGLSQGRAAAALSALGASLGIVCHTLAASFGLSLLIQSSPHAFLVVKIVGAVYLIWLGYKAFTAGGLISFEPAARQPLRRIFATGLLTAVLNPKPGLFILAFLPQFVDASRGAVTPQMLVYGAIFATLTLVIFSLMGCFAARFTGWLQRRPTMLRGVNRGAGASFIAAGMSVFALQQRL